MLRLLAPSSKKRSSREEDSSCDESSDRIVSVLVRVPSKEDGLVNLNNSATKPHQTDRLKKRTSSKEDLPEDSAPVLKRINSKEDVRKVSISVVPTLGLTVQTQQQAECRTGHSSRKKQSVVALGLASLEAAMADKQRIRTALDVAKAHHCEEGLEFLQAVIERERLKEKTRARERKTNQIKRCFIKENSPREIFLPPQLRQRLLNSSGIPFELALADAKRHILNDLRFNERVLQALTMREQPENIE